VSATILVVDDEADVEALFRQHFRREIRDGRFNMVFASSGDEALQRIEAFACRKIIRGDDRYWASGGANVWLVQIRAA
jgi:CheY-like chemotaxis protein